MKIPYLNQEMLSIVHQMAMAKLGKTGTPKEIESSFLAKLDQIAHELHRIALMNFWAVFKRLVIHNKITAGVEYQVQDGKLDIRLTDIYDLYADTMRQYLPNEQLISKELLYDMLAKDINYVRLHKPFFGGSKKWCIQFYHVGQDSPLAETELPNK